MICRYVSWRSDYFDRWLIKRGARHISNPHSLARASVYRFRMGGWRRVRGRAFGFWSFGMGSRGGRCWLLFRGRRCDNAPMMNDYDVMNGDGFGYIS